jgi:hypothetical protein
MLVLWVYQLIPGDPDSYEEAAARLPVITNGCTAELLPQEFIRMCGRVIAYRRTHRSCMQSHSIYTISYFFFLGFDKNGVALKVSMFRALFSHFKSAEKLR